jgi:hypothetical protein
MSLSTDGVDGRAHHIKLPHLDTAGDSAPGSIVELRRFEDAAGRSQFAIAVRSDLAIETQVVAQGAIWLDCQLVAKEPIALVWQKPSGAKWVEGGPDLKNNGVVPWRRADLRDRIVAKFNVHLHERSVGKLMKKLNFSSMSVRPVHPQSDLEAQEAFKKNAELVRTAILQELVGQPAENYERR